MGQKSDVEFQVSVKLDVESHKLDHPVVLSIAVGGGGAQLAEGVYLLKAGGKIVAAVSCRKEFLPRVRREVWEVVSATGGNNNYESFDYVVMGGGEEETVEWLQASGSSSDADDSPLLFCTKLNPQESGYAPPATNVYLHRWIGQTSRVSDAPYKHT